MPHNYIQSSVVGVGTGPAKIIQIYYPGSKSSDTLTKILMSVKSTISSLGIDKVTDFFLENTFCELWRLAIQTKTINSVMSGEGKKVALSSDVFQEEILMGSVTKNPDVYYVNPFTGKYQHLFRVSGTELIMRPSTMKQNNSTSITLVCKIEHDLLHSGKTEVYWSGDLLQREKILPSSLFV